jgi:UDP-glucuronate decarboxylase
MRTCIYGAFSVLGLAGRCNAKVLQASTSEVYGDPTIHPQMENYVGSVNPIGPRACYDEGKRAAETIFMDSYRKYKTKVKIARIFNTYGPRMHPYDGRVVSNFIRQALADEPITIHGNGRQTRSFCYRDDLVEGLIRLMATDDDFVGPINIGNPTEFMIAELADKVITLTGTDSKVVWKPRPVDDPCRRKPDITLANMTLDWYPKVDLTEGIIQTIRWFKTINLADYTPPTPNY